jgi:hypothetical protein
LERNGWGYQRCGEWELGGWDEVQPAMRGGKEGGKMNNRRRRARITTRR